MEHKHHSLHFLRQRRFFTLLPLIVIPFITLIFWLLGGGGSNPAKAIGLSHEGLIKTLPDAKLNSQSASDKLSYYANAASDSAKLLEQKKSDPNFQDELATQPRLDETGHLADLTSSKSSYQDPNEEKVYKKLEQLNSALNNSNSYNEPKSLKSRLPPKSTSTNSREVDRLQKMMAAMQGSGEEDPEIKQINEVLEKIISIQNPENNKQESANSNSEIPAKPYSTIPAIVVDNQKVTQGTVIKIQLLDSLIIKGQVIPKGHFLYGSAQFSNQRLSLRIKSIRLDYSIIPVDLTVYDMNDSMEGINVPEALTEDALRNGSANAVQGLQILDMDQSIPTQLAGAGISAAKGLFNKKVKRVKARLKSGYPVLLRNNQKQ